MKAVTDLRDSIAGIVQGAGKCERCGATTRLHNGCCVSCLLNENFEAEVEASAEVFEGVLAEADVPDKEWRLGNYQILEEIGRGGMGVIYRARQRHSGRIVALKRVLTYHADSHETLARFRREAEAAASLDHPNILPVHEVSETEDKLPFFSMKFAAGGNLRTAASALRSGPRECVRLIAKVARAIAYAHAQGILHRDLQPGNILLDGRGEPLVSDFGLAKWLDEESDLTRTLTTFGTPGYIAPEQAEGTQFSSAADIYSLGAILFYLLAGRPPFVGANALAVIQQASATPAPKLRSFVASLDRDLETIVARCLERDPKARYQSAAALAEDLERWLEGRPIVARPVRAPARAWRWSRRNPILAGAVTASLLLALAVIWLLREKLFTPATAVPEKSVAVLPFNYLGEDKANAYLADGIQDEVLTDLAKIADLKVISRTSVMHYKSGTQGNLREIGRQLGVAHVVEGTVERSGNRVRVNAQLLDARTDRHLWGETYDRDLSNVFAIQGEIARAIAEQLQAKLSPAEENAIERPPTSDLPAFDLYTRAKNLIFGGTLASTVRTDFLRAVDLLNEAVGRDPSFLDAYCHLAYAHDAIYFAGYDHTPARLALAEAAIQTAFRLRPNAGEAHLARALNLYWGYLDYDGALAELEVAGQTLFNDARVFVWKGYIERRQGRWEESTRNLQRAIELDPRNVETLQQTALSYEYLRRFGEQKSMLDLVLAIVPNDAVTEAARALVELNRQADTKPLHQVVDSIRTTNPAATQSIADTWLICALAERDPAAAKDALTAFNENPPHLTSDNVPLTRLFMEGVIARMMKDDDKARSAFIAARAEQEKTVQAQPSYGPAVCVLGLIDAGLGRKEDALREGRRAVELLPVEKDAINGPAMIKYLAMIAAWVGDKDFACEQLASAVRFPNSPSYGQLKLLPFWDPLRGDPRFEKIVASLAPK
jgi:TolB-like protein/tetratricopeptide (TPR) repeat protein/tRNA A-37 threonylcarbamoyl transferase component Bud32